MSEANRIRNPFLDCQSILGVSRCRETVTQTENQLLFTVVVSFLIVMALLMGFPEISLWLPSMMQ